MSKTKQAINEDERGFRFSIAEDNGRDVIIEVSEEDYQRELAQGVEEEFLLKPGRHKFRRGGFLERHGVTPEEVRAAAAKVHISIKLDADVLEYFKARAASPDAAGYQTQINNELRRVMERDNGESSKVRKR